MSLDYLVGMSFDAQFTNQINIYHKLLVIFAMDFFGLLHVHHADLLLMKGFGYLAEQRRAQSAL